MNTPQPTIQLPANYRVSVKALIRDPADKDRIMLIREADGTWEFPGGGLDHGEQSKLGLAREIQEELGVGVASISDSPIDFWTIYKAVSDNFGYFAFVLYEVVIADNNFKISDEAQEVAYFTMEDASNLNLHPNVTPYFI